MGGVVVRLRFWRADEPLTLVGQWKALKRLMPLELPNHPPQTPRVIFAEPDERVRPRKPRTFQEWQQRYRRSA